jgi:hypothetical protein
MARLVRAMTDGNVVQSNFLRHRIMTTETSYANAGLDKDRLFPKRKFTSAQLCL